MIYDGDCGFCRLWIARWQGITGDRVEYRSSQEVAAEFPEIPADVFANSVQFIDADGRRHERAAAVFGALAPALAAGRLLAWAHARVGAFRRAADGAYDFVARNRTLFSRLTRWLWGADVTRPTYAVATTIFLRLLGFVYLIAFASFGAQARGLVGERGILPIREVLPQVAEGLGAEAWQQWPTLLWLNSSDAMLLGLTWAGAVFAGMVILGWLQPLALLGAWAAYLSLVVAGQDFFSFQWDLLLLETGLVAVLAAPWRWRPNLGWCRPAELAHFALIYLLFRLMLSSGVVKLSSGDPTWAHLTALDFHYWTQPLPTIGSWIAAQAPAWFQRLCAAGVLGIELALPVFVFFPRRPRLVAFGGFVALQALILLTGNYGFFNLLTLALCLLLFDDAFWPRGWRTQIFAATKGGWHRFGIPLLVIAYLALSAVPFAMAFRKMPAFIAPLARVYEFVAPFRSVNGYGLFAVMTTRRPEIEIEGSRDGIEWKAYEFKYKPGPLNRPPPWVAPYLPRLDWVMWFAAMDHPIASPWLAPFVRRLLEGEPEVLALLGKNPFGAEPPRYVRGRRHRYRFTTFAEWRATGDWWVREPGGGYFAPTTLESFRR